ncbi:MAG: DUF2235 domain-containing protein [Vicinamibacterales bacterium]
MSGKRIVICSDGTGNTAIKGRGTNVFKVFEAVDLDTHRYDPSVTPQIAIYDDGVGTESFKPLKVLGGAAGLGLSRNVRHLYSELSRVYDPGDEIYMFGFSRGAFTVRTLVGLIARCGIIDPSRLQPRSAATFRKTVKQAWKAYKQSYPPTFLAWRRSSKTAAQEFKAAHSYAVDVKVRFVGVWDTVDAVGLPFRLPDLINTVFYRFKFPDLRLSHVVERACHALAVDDERQSFHPLMWDESSEPNGRISQVWFAGAHSNVGGGYPKQGMSLVALDWMLEEAEKAGRPFGEAGLRLNKGERASFREHASVDDKLYNPRSGLGVFYRWKMRDIADICARNGVRPKVHVSVLERISHGTDDYSPGNLPANAEVVYTTPPLSGHAALAEVRARALQNVLASTEQPALMCRTRGLESIGRVSYYLSTACEVMALALAVRPMHLSQWIRFPDVQTNEMMVIAVPSPASVVDWLMQHPWLSESVLLLASGFVASLACALIVEMRLHDHYSSVWFSKQPELREALREARVQAAVADQNIG